MVESLRAEAAKSRDEAAALRREAGKLRAQRDTLQLQLERIGQHAGTKVRVDTQGEDTEYKRLMKKKAYMKSSFTLPV